MYVIKVKYNTPELLKLKIFERVNQSGTKLNGQELRHALHQGSVTKLLQELSEGSSISSFISNKRMKDRYLILRYVAMRLYILNQLKFYNEDTAVKNVEYSEINTFLANAMDAINTFSVKQLECIKQDFFQCFDKAINLLNKKAFRIEVCAPVNMILFETTLLLISLTKKYHLSNKKIINMIYDFRRIDEENIDEYGNTPFFQNIKFHRDAKENFIQRMKWLNDIISKYKE